MSQPYPVPIPIPQSKSRPLPDSRGIPDTLNLLFFFGKHIKGFFDVSYCNPIGPHEKRLISCKSMQILSLISPKSSQLAFLVPVAVLILDRISFLGWYRDCGILEWNPVPFPIPSCTRIPSRYRFLRDTGWGLEYVNQNPEAVISSSSDGQNVRGY